MTIPASIAIPANQRAAIHELAGLTDEAYAALRQCLAEGLVNVEPNAWLERTSRAVEPHTRLGGQIVGAVMGMRSLIDRAMMSAEEVAVGVVRDAQTKAVVSADTTEVLTRRLTELLKTRSVALSAKAFSLVVSDATPFNDVRIVSDVRPIFADQDGGLDLGGSIIVHHLHIEVGGEGENQHSALTTSDLLTLRRAVERALEKDKKLRDALRSGPLTPLEASTAIDGEM